MNQREIEKWESRIIRPARKFKFKDTTDLSSLDRAIMSTMNDFVIFVSSSEVSTYKIARRMIELGVSNSQITFMQPIIADSCFKLMEFGGTNKSAYFNRERLKEYLSVYESSIKGKFVILPRVAAPIPVDAVVSFISLLKESEARGLILYSEKVPGCISEVICSDLNLGFQFPSKEYAARRSTLKEDGF